MEAVLSTLEKLVSEETMLLVIARDTNAKHETWGRGGML